MAANALTGGPFQDPAGNPAANGYILFKLNIDQIEAASSIAVPSGRVIRVPLDADGNVVTSPTYSLWPNNLLTGFDGSTDQSFYFVSVYSNKGQLIWGPFAQTVHDSPSPFNISVWVPNKLTY
jgi:hypothetical protein